MCVCVHLSIYLSIYIYLSISIYLSIYLYLYLYLYIHIYSFTCSIVREVFSPCFVLWERAQSCNQKGEDRLSLGEVVCGHCC